MPLSVSPYIPASQDQTKEFGASAPAHTFASAQNVAQSLPTDNVALLEYLQSVGCDQSHAGRSASQLSQQSQPAAAPHSNTGSNASLAVRSFSLTAQDSAQAIPNGCSKARHTGSRPLSCSVTGSSNVQSGRQSSQGSFTAAIAGQSAREQLSTAADELSHIKLWRCYTLLVHLTRTVLLCMHIFSFTQTTSTLPHIQG